MKRRHPGDCGDSVEYTLFFDEEGIDFGTDWPLHLLGSNGQEWATLPIRWGNTSVVLETTCASPGKHSTASFHRSCHCYCYCCCDYLRHETRSSMGSTDLGLKEAGVPSFSPRALLHCQHSMMCSFSLCRQWPPGSVRITILSEGFSQENTRSLPPCSGSPGSRSCCCLRYGS